MATKDTTQNSNKKSKKNNNRINYDKQNREIEKNKKNNNSNNKKTKKKNNVFIKKYKIDILDVLILIVFTIIASSFITGFIFNYQYKKHRSANEDLLYSESFSKFASVLEEVKKNYYEEITEDELIDAALNGMLDYLGDKYSIYLNNEDTEELTSSLEGEYKGIGIVCSGTLIIYVYDGSPASNAGIEAYDVIKTVNDVEITEENYLEISNLIKKDEDNKVVIERDGKEHTFTVKTDNVVVPSVGGEVLKHKNTKVGYIRITSFSANTYSQLIDELGKVEKDEIVSLVLDLRSNSGGYLKSAFNIANVFLEEDKVVYSLETKDDTKEYKDETEESKDYKIIVLIDEYTASAAEVLAAALKDSYGATLVGAKSYGKGKVQTLLPYGNSLVKYTSAKWLRPNGECVDEVGITPDYEVKNVIKGNVLYDNQLEKALDIAVEKEK